MYVLDLVVCDFCVCFQINNPDMRVQILKDFVKQHFTSTQLLDYALDVEKITTSKVSLSPLTASLTFEARIRFPTLGCFLPRFALHSVVSVANRNPTLSWTWMVSLVLPLWTFSERVVASQGKLSQFETEYRLVETFQERPELNPKLI